MSEEKKKDAEAAPAEPKAGGSMLGKLLIALFIGGVILTECVLAYLWLPGPNDVLAHQAHGATPKDDKHHEDEKKKDEEKHDIAEIDLGEYSITSHQPSSGNTLFITFKLVGTVLESDEKEFEKLLERNRHRFREQILVEVRNSAVPDLTDPGLGLIKRRILEKSNALFGKSLLQTIVFSDFSFVEQ